MAAVVGVLRSSSVYGGCSMYIKNNLGREGGSSN